MITNDLNTSFATTNYWRCFVCSNRRIIHCRLVSVIQIVRSMVSPEKTKKQVSVIYPEKNTKDKIQQSSCEIEGIVETNICKLRAILRWRVLLGMCPYKDVGRRLPIQLQCSFYRGQQGGVDQSAHGNYKTWCLEDKL